MPHYIIIEIQFDRVSINFLCANILENFLSKVQSGKIKISNSIHFILTLKIEILIVCIYHQFNIIMSILQWLDIAQLLSNSICQSRKARMTWCWDQGQHRRCPKYCTNLGTFQSLAQCTLKMFIVGSVVHIYNI